MGSYAMPSEKKTSFPLGSRRAAVSCMKIMVLTVKDFHCGVNCNENQSHRAPFSPPGQDRFFRPAIIGDTGSVLDFT